MNYEKYDTWWTQTKRTQTNPNEPKVKIGKMNASSLLTRDYRNQPSVAFRKTNPIQTQTNPIKLSLAQLALSAVERVEWTQPPQRPRNERNCLFYKELRKPACPQPPENKPNQNQSRNRAKAHCLLLESKARNCRSEIEFSSQSTKSLSMSSKDLPLVSGSFRKMTTNPITQIAPYSQNAP